MYVYIYKLIKNSPPHPQHAHAHTFNLWETPVHLFYVVKSSYFITPHVVLKGKVQRRWG